MLRLEGIYLPAATVKKAEVSHPFNEETCFASKAFTYVLQPSRRPRSVIHSTNRYMLASKAFTYPLQPSRRPRSVIHSTKRYMLRFEGIYLPPATVKKAEVSHPFNEEIYASKA